MIPSLYVLILISVLYVTDVFCFHWSITTDALSKRNWTQLKVPIMRYVLIHVFPKHLENIPNMMRVYYVTSDDSNRNSYIWVVIWNIRKPTIIFFQIKYVDDTSSIFYPFNSKRLEMKIFQKYGNMQLNGHFLSGVDMLTSTHWSKETLLSFSFQIFW